MKIFSNSLIRFCALFGCALAFPVYLQAQSDMGDLHTREFEGRDKTVWAMMREDFAGSFPRGGSPVGSEPFMQDEATIMDLKDSGLGALLKNRAGGSDADAIAEKNGAASPANDRLVAKLTQSLAERQKRVVDFNGAQYAVRERRLVRVLADGKEERAAEAGRNGPPDSEVTDIAIGPDKNLWVATPSGIGILNDQGKWSHLTGEKGGLPVNHVTCLASATDGTIWVGTIHGAARRNKDGRWNYRAGSRWMLGDAVIDIGTLENGGAWVLTEASYSQIEPRRMTLREKAKIFDDITQKRHVRHGAIGECGFRNPDDLDTWVMGDNDNDGLWTSIYAAAKCFEYAATKDEEAKRLAKRHFDFLARLESITGIPGQVARSIRPNTFEKETHEEYGYKGHGQWHQSTVEPGWQWKSDTSSDEYSGHYFIWGIYYDLVAKGDAAEEKRVQELVRRVTNKLIDNDFTIVDIDGLPTRWGIYTPRLLNGDLLWSDEFGLHSLCVLAHMKVAIHVCGDQRFKDAYNDLIEKHKYNVKAMHAKEMLPNNPNAGVNHSDTEMAWLAYYHLLLYPDENEKLTWQYKYSAIRSMRAELLERSPLWNFTFALGFPDYAHVADGVDSLERWPLDLRTWKVRNSVRDDVIIEPRSRQRTRGIYLIEPVPFDERVPKKWNHNPYAADDGRDDGKEELDGGSWLLPYWMGVYHGFIHEG